jgi:DNA-binding transcriptional MerR regulator
MEWCWVFTLKAGVAEKKYYRIGEVCEIAGLKQHVLRYWESEFKKFIRPHRPSSKQRLYRRSDIDNILKIKTLLRDEGYTIPGAKKFLSEGKDVQRAEQPGPASTDPKQFVADLKEELVAIQNILKKE